MYLKMFSDGLSSSYLTVIQYFSLAASTNKVYGFGRNGYGALSISKKEVSRPQVVEGLFPPAGLRILDIQASSHTKALL